jgi:hypothetical protein
MVGEKDAKLLDFLLTSTEAGKVPWQPTAADNQFTASFRGKYNVLVGTGSNGPWLRMANEQDQVMLYILNNEDPMDRIERIFESARRIALNVDTAIDEIIQE